MLIGVTYSPNSGSVSRSRNLHTPLDLHARRDAEADADPVGVLVLAQLVLRPVDLEDGAVRALDRDDERQPSARRGR